MKKTKRILSLVAVSLVAVFALSCFLFAACGKDDDSGSDTHEHSWDEGVVTLEPTCAEEGEMTYTCECGETKTEPIPATGEHQFGEWTLKSAADCGNDEVDERVCSVCGKTEEQIKENSATGEHTYDKAVFTWNPTEEGGYTATASLTCSVCGAVDGQNMDVEATVTGPETTDEGDTYTATATLDETEYTDTWTVPLETEEENDDETVTVPSEYENKNVYSLGVDFGNADTYGWIGTPATSGTLDDETTYTYLSVSTGDYQTGLLKYHVAASDVTVGKELAGALYTKDNAGDYFAIDLTGLSGDYVTVEVRMARNGDKDTGTLTLATALSGGTTLTSVSSSSKEDKHTLAYGGVIGEEETLYLTWDKNLQIYSIDINVYGDVEVSEPEAETTITLNKTELKLTLSDGTASGEVTATITGADGNPYSVDTPTAACDDTSDSITVEVAGSGTNGSYKITVTATGTAENVTVKVTAGEAEATFTVSVREASLTVTVNKSAMNLTGENASDASIVSITDEWGNDYGGGDIEVTPTSSEDSIATAAYGNGKVTVTAIACGRATITVTFVKDGSTLETATIIVDVVAPSFDDATEGVYTAEYTAGESSFTATCDGTDSEGETAVSFTSTVDSFKEGGKSVRGNETTEYTYYGEVKSYSSKGIAVTIGAGVTADITVYASHTSSACRTIYISSETTAEAGDFAAGQSIEGSGSSGQRDRDYVIPVTATGLGGGTYYIYTDGDTVHVYDVVVTYTYTSEAPKTLEIQANLANAPFNAETERASLDDCGVLYFYDDGKEACWNPSGGYMYTSEGGDGDASGRTKSLADGTVTKYFLINLSNVNAQTLSISVEFSAETSNQKTGFMELTTELESFTGSETASSLDSGKILATQNVNSSNGTTKVTLSATNIDVSSYEYLYIEFSVAVRVYSVSITINPQA